ncbi:MAG: hypothetical protein RLZZ126_110 [Pseudomonadota bacterium]|jgi:O-antigen biosynthesis protein WbqP
MKRPLDFLLALLMGMLCALPLLLIALTVRLSSPGPAIYWSRRIGRNGVEFQMPKFRTMRVDTPAVATHLLDRPEQYLTPIGGFLRKSSLDELPQLWSIIVGDMSWVGPRPALFNQDDLMSLRRANGVDRLTPGITGWAQINGRDEIPIPQKVALELEYLQQQSLGFDLKIMLLTAKKVIWRENISH